MPMTSQLVLCKIFLNDFNSRTDIKNRLKPTGWKVCVLVFHALQVLRMCLKCQAFQNKISNQSGQENKI